MNMSKERGKLIHFSFNTNDLVVVIRKDCNHNDYSTPGKSYLST